MNGRVHPPMSDARRGAAPALARVLLVEDDPDMRMLAERVLASQGHDLDTAREAGQRWPCMRILLSSGHLDDAAPDTGRWRLLPKPDTPAALLRAVARALEDQGASEA